VVQTLDFFTPIVDDPYAYGQIAAANALSDVYAMGGRPLTVLNIACFDPAAAPAEVWAQVLKGAYDKTIEAGAVVVGGHTVEDPMPKFGSVTGIVDPDRIFRNDAAEPGDDIYLSKPLGTGIITTAAKFDKSTEEELFKATESMRRLNDKASQAAHDAGAKCATDVTGFGLAGHLSHIAKASFVGIEIDSGALPVLPGIKRLVALNAITGGAAATAHYLSELLEFDDKVEYWIRELVVDPQTSGGLAVFSKKPVEGSTWIGRAISGPPRIIVQ